MDCNVRTCKDSQALRSGTRRRVPAACQQTQQAIVRVDPRPEPGVPLKDLAPLLNKRQVSERISLSVSWLNQAFARGDFPRPIYLGRNAAWPQRWVDEWISAQVQANLAHEQSAQDGRSRGADLKAKA